MGALTRNTLTWQKIVDLLSDNVLHGSGYHISGGDIEGMHRQGSVPAAMTKNKAHATDGLLKTGTIRPLPLIDFNLHPCLPAEGEETPDHSDVNAFVELMLDGNHYGDVKSMINDLILMRAYYPNNKTVPASEILQSTREVSKVHPD